MQEVKYKIAKLRTIIYSDDLRQRGDISSKFESVGKYYSKNANAGFVASPEETVASYTFARENGYVIAGVFHTHLRHPSYLAKIDIDLHPSKDLPHLLISLRNPAMPEIRGYKISEKGAKEISVYEINQRHTSVIDISNIFADRNFLNRTRVQSAAFPGESIKFDNIEIGKTLVTNGQFAKIFPYSAAASLNPDLPVINVTYSDATAFCIHTKTRLLTEDEWIKYAGSIGATSNRDQKNASLQQYAVFSESPWNDIAPVATQNPNEHGLYDMRGNAWEWCLSTKADIAPSKGGSYYSFAEMCTNDTCIELPKNYSARDLGFRVCRDR